MKSRHVWCHNKHLPHVSLSACIQLEAAAELDTDWTRIVCLYSPFHLALDDVAPGCHLLDDPRCVQCDTCSAHMSHLCHRDLWLD